MLPSKSEWKNWDSIQKATYLALPIAMVTTVVAILAWMASNQSTRQQQEMFSATNQPIIELVDAEFSTGVGGHIRFTLKNSGQSKALGVRVGIYQVSKNGEILFEDNELLVTGGTSSYPAFGLQQGLVNTSVLLPIEDVSSRTGYIPTRMVISPGRQPGRDPFLFNLFWKDVTGNEHRNMYVLEFYE